MKADSKMQTGTPTRASHGKLNRDVQRKLGETLHAMFDEIVKEGVPDRFAKLLEQIEDGGQSASAGVSTESRVTESSEQAVGSNRAVQKAGDEGSN